VIVLGSDEALGSWKPSCGLHLETSTSEFPIWRSTCSLAAGKEIEWKVAILQAGGNCRWEDIANRRLVLPSASDAGSLALRVAFNDGRLDMRIMPVTRVTEELALPRSQPVMVDTTTQGGLNNVRQQFIGFDLAHSRFEDDAIQRPKVEVVFEADNSRHELCFDEDRGIYVFFPHTASLRPGLCRFFFLVSGERALSNMHPVVSESNVMLLHGSLLQYAWDYKSRMEASSTTDLILPMKIIPETSTRLLRRQTRHFDPCDVTDGDDSFDNSICLKPMDREASAVSMASTCDSLSELCSSDEDLQARAIVLSSEFAQGIVVEHSDDSSVTTEAVFSEQVFKQLYGADLRCLLDGHLPPDSPSACRPLRLLSGASRLPKPGGRCEDAFFVGSHALGVADGVGAMANYARFGVDAAAYSAELMELSSKALLPGGSAWQAPQDKKTKVAAYAAKALALAEIGAKSYGASTATVLALEKNTVGVANLGDSGFMLLRKMPRGMAIIERSREQQHSWNLPYQLLRVPPRLTSRLPKNIKLDSADDCEQYEVTVRVGDLLILFTDGLSDNLHSEEVLQIVNRTLSPAFGELLGSPGLTTPAENVAKALALAARERSRDPVAKVPFVENSRLQGHSECQGGKVDDITVVVAWVVPDEN